MNSITGTRHRIVQGLLINPGAQAKSQVPRDNGAGGGGVATEEAAIAMCDALLDLLSETLEVPSSLLRSRARCSASVARGRQVGMYLAHTCLGLTMAQVASGFLRNKSTVVHACHTIEDLRDDDTFDAFVSRQERIIKVIVEGPWHGRAIEK